MVTLNSNAIGLSIIFAVYFCLDCTTGRPFDKTIVNSSSDVTSFVHNDDDSRSIIPVDGDMLLTVDQYNTLYGRQNTVNTINSKTSTRNKRKAKTFSTRWPNRRIPYRIEPFTFSNKEVAEIRRAINQWETNTCLRFPRATKRDYNYINFQNGVGCNSKVGMIRGKQAIVLATGCRIMRKIAHEIGHAIGFLHEHNRPDRDNYVIIKYKNVKHGSEVWFRKTDFSQVSTYNIPYDYNSIMHYPAGSFAKSKGLTTIVTKNKAYQNVIGTGQSLSNRDIQLANRMYKCY